MLGHHSDYIQNILAHDTDAPFWSAADHSHRVADITVPVSLVGGWYDMFLPGQLRDFRTLQDTGRTVRVTIGPWPHTALEIGGLMAREAVDFGMA